MAMQQMARSRASELGGWVAKGCMRMKSWAVVFGGDSLNVFGGMQCVVGGWMSMRQTMHLQAEVFEGWRRVVRGGADAMRRTRLPSCGVFRGWRCVDGGGHPLSLHLPIGEAGGGRQGGEEEVVVVDEIRLVVGNLRYVLGRRCITKVNSVAVHQCLALVSMMSR